MSDLSPYRAAATVDREQCAFCGEPTEIRMGAVPVCSLHAKDPNDAQVERAARAIVDGAVKVAVAEAFMARRR